MTTGSGSSVIAGGVVSGTTTGGGGIKGGEVGGGVAMTGFVMIPGCGCCACVVGVMGVLDSATTGEGVSVTGVATGLLCASCSTHSPFNTFTTALAAPAHNTMTGRVPATVFKTVG